MKTRETPEDVIIPGERHLIIHGQLGNLENKLDWLRRICTEHDYPGIERLVTEIEDELFYLKKVYPQLDGGFVPVAVKSEAQDKETKIPEPITRLNNSKMRSYLRDMRALVDAAYLGYTHEGTIDCQLKVMFDYAWEAAAQMALPDSVDDIPF